MDCSEARIQLLESFEDVSPPGASELRAHVADCAGCAAIAAEQTALDRRLSAMFPPPQLSPGFRPALQRRIQRESARLSPSLPDVVHFASCGAATVLCAAVLPFVAVMVLGAGAAATSVTYLLLLAVRDWLENVEGVGA